MWFVGWFQFVFWFVKFVFFLMEKMGCWNLLVGLSIFCLV